MLRSRDPARYRRHLCEGWPIVLNLLAITVLEQTLDTALRFGMTPLDLLAPHAVAAPFWLGLIWGLFALTVLRRSRAAIVAAAGAWWYR
jgi:hypothetical protein